mmetsp:Transcript_17177/g.42662  ORF Transcript_17177/g.42662 Transcript_17177/m.42662 type:complete len:232 (-) Transcript_17177:667-1362(-)
MLTASFWRRCASWSSVSANFRQRCAIFRSFDPDAATLRPALVSIIFCRTAFFFVKTAGVWAPSFSALEAEDPSSRSSSEPAQLPPAHLPWSSSDEAPWYFPTPPAVPPPAPRALFACPCILLPAASRCSAAFVAASATLRWSFASFFIRGATSLSSVVACVSRLSADFRAFWAWFSRFAAPFATKACALSSTPSCAFLFAFSGFPFSSFFFSSSIASSCFRSCSLSRVEEG